MAKRFAWLNSSVIETSPITMTLSRGARRMPNSETAIHQPYFLFVGKLIEEKGIQELLTAYEKASELQPLPRLLIVGTGKLKDEVEDSTSYMDQVKYLGYINNPAKLADLYSGASALLLPTRGEWEGVPRVLTEAKSFDVPIWATPLPTIIGEFGADINYFRSVTPQADEICQLLLEVPIFTGERSGGIIGAPAAAAQHLAAICPGRQ